MSELMAATVDAGSEAAEDNAASYVLSGETKLLDVEGPVEQHVAAARALQTLRAAHRPAPALDLSNRAEGVQIFIGGESGLAPLDGCSVITAPYGSTARWSVRSVSSAPPGWPTTA